MGFSSEEEAFASLVQAVGGAQARNVALNHILRDLVIQIAKGQPDPAKYLSVMFERVSSTVEQGETEEKISHPVNAEIKWVLESFFSNASLAIRAKP